MSKVYFLPIGAYNDIPKIIDKIHTENSIFAKNHTTAIKVHFGEKNSTGYVKPYQIKPVIQHLLSLGIQTFLTDTNTLYDGERSNALKHLRIAYEHGFKFADLNCPVIIADGITGNAYKEVEVHLKHFTTVKVAEAIYFADSLVFISHVKGHDVCGFGGALKNIGMGCAAKPGKNEMHRSAILYVDVTKCIGCSECTNACPTKAIALINLIKEKKGNEC